MRTWISLASFVMMLTPSPLRAEGPLACTVPRAEFEFRGIIRSRVEANIDQWLLPTPEANPGLLGMFRLRDRLPEPRLVPWAGEFAGKYLISMVQAMRMTPRADLRAHADRFVRELIQTQDEDGYFGPFPRHRRLLGEWDLWGHYHIMQGLLSWADLTGGSEAAQAARRAADLICRTYLDGPRRVADAGSEEMNMAVGHVMADLHRRTGEPRYLRMAREIEKDWERAGDYLRTGLAGTPFYRTPRPRWESLHDLQQLTAMWRITGEQRYRDAFTNHWRTIRDADRRNSGAFSGGEQATGNAWAPTAIETCCTVAWMALTEDMLQLSGDARVADELELSLLNGGLGAQHPGGRWWTYSTPMDGDRKASTHEIVFQARAGTPELNCCSANGPRALGMLSEWAVMQAGDALAVNWYGPFSATLKDFPGGQVSMRCESEYPDDGMIRCRITSDRPLTVRFRIPAWAQRATAHQAGAPLQPVPGTWMEVHRTAWRQEEPVELHFPMPLRMVQGEREQRGKACLYRGPLLLAWDQADNAGDEAGMPRLDPAALARAEKLSAARSDALVRPWVLMQLPGLTAPLVLRDFATAGMSGTRYRSWLRAGPRSGAPVNEEGLALCVPLRGRVEPDFGAATEAGAFTPGEDFVHLDGDSGKLKYALPEDFGGDFTVAVRVRLTNPPPARLAQIFSAWTAVSDDPLRLVLDHGKLFARIESGGNWSTGGVELPLQTWQHVAAVKSGTRLQLFLNGTEVSSVEVPAFLSTASSVCSIGGNPLYQGGPEGLQADFQDLIVLMKPLRAPEISTLARSEPKK